MRAASGTDDKSDECDAFRTRPVRVTKTHPVKGSAARS